MLGEVSGVILIAACGAVTLLLAAGTARLWRAAAPRPPGPPD